MASFAVVGAGLAGLLVARELSRDHAINVFEKSRGVGGRMASRNAGSFEFDHGAQFFTARSDAFLSYLAPMIDDGVIADWPARFAEIRRSEITSTRPWASDYPHFVGVPRMNAVGKQLASGLDISLEITVGRISRRDDRWELFDHLDNALGAFDWVVLTAPAAQTATLALESSIVGDFAAPARMRACFALMLGFEEPLELGWQAALVRDADISWISVNSSKPGRNDAFSLVVHSTNVWADDHLDLDLATARAHLLDECSTAIGYDARRAAFIELHRWRFANIGRQHTAPCIVDVTNRIAAAGDWFIRGRVESAFTSAMSLVAKLRALA